MSDEELGETSLITSKGRTVFGVRFVQRRAFWASSLWSLLVVIRAIPVQARGGALLGRCHDVIPTRQMLKAAEQRHFSIKRVVILFRVTSKGRIILFRD